MKLGRLTTMVGNRIRVEFDRLDERTVELLAKCYVLSASVAAVSPGPVATHLFGFCHDFLCTPARHAHVEAFEKALLADVGEILSQEILAGLESGEIKPTKKELRGGAVGMADPAEIPGMIEELKRVLEEQGASEVQVMTLDEAKAKGLVPPGFKIPKP